MEQLWQSVLSNSLYSKQVIFAAMCSLVTLVGYYLHGWFFILADEFRFLDAYAIRTGKHRVPSKSLIRAAIKEATIDTFVIKPPLFYFLFHLMEAYVSFAELPSLSAGFVQWMVMELSFSVTFYMAHRLLHSSSVLYKHIHKIHHTFHESIGFAAQYSHVLENIIAGFHIAAAAILVKPHVAIFWIYLFTRYVEIIDAHSGYEVPWRMIYPWASCYPWSCGSTMHDFHHSHNMGTYGGGILSVDKLLGTDKEFNEFLKRKQRLSDL